MAAAKKSAKTGSKTAAKKPVRKAAKKAAGNEQDGRNRRRFDRRDTRINARLEHAGGSVEGTVTNLSLEGCLFSPVVDLPVGGRIKLRLTGEKPVAATVKGISERGVHCLLHAGGVTLGRLSADLDDMALLMLKSGRPHQPAAKKKAAD